MLKHCSKTRFMHQTLTRKQCSVGLDGLFRLPNAKSSLPNVSDKWLKVPCKLHLKQACFVSICAHQLLTFPNCPWCHRLFSNCFLSRLPMLLGYLHPCITKLKEKTEQSSKHEIRSWLKRKEQRLPFTDGEENIPPRIQKRPAHGDISGFCRKEGFSLSK